MRAKLVGVHRVKSNGKVYCYAWRGGPRIKAPEGSADFLAEYLRLIRHRPVEAQEGTLGAVLAEYRGSQEYQKLAPSTRRRNDPILAAIMQEYGDMPLELVEAKGARREFLRWREEIAKRTPRTADMHIAVLKRILSWAVDNELLAVNKLAGAKKIHDGTRREAVWSEEECKALTSSASLVMVRSFLLALNTAQRQGDLLKLKWSAYDGQIIHLRQSKTGEIVRLRCSPELKALLDSLPRTAVTILTNSHGKPWTSSGFQASWKKAVKKAGIKDRTYHDLRGTFCTRKYAEGWSFRQIAEVTGHSERQAEEIIRKHYLATDLGTKTA